MSHTTKNGSVAVRAACAIFFILFCFLYLYNYQDDVMAVTQHVLSRGATHYNRLVGAVLITLVLWLLQLTIYGVARLERMAHALTYLPSMLLLGILTDVTPHVDTDPYLGNWLWGFPLIMVAYAFVVWVCRQFETLEGGPAAGLAGNVWWVNLLAMGAMALMTCGIGCSDEVFHYRMRVESNIEAGRYDDALTVGDNEEKTDSSLTMLRIWALSEKHLLGERLFEYPLVGQSDAMMPNGSSVKVLMAPQMRLYKLLGVYYRQKLRPREYLEKIHDKWWATVESNDWLLCAYLLDCDLDAFAYNITRYYKLDNHLPKHYREALILYTHLREHPYLVYHDSVMDADFEDFQDLGRKYANRVERNAMLRDSYGKTYWMYYYGRRR